MYKTTTTSSRKASQNKTLIIQQNEACTLISKLMFNEISQKHCWELGKSHNTDGPLLIG